MSAKTFDLGFAMARASAGKVEIMSPCDASDGLVIPAQSIGLFRIQDIEALRAACDVHLARSRHAPPKSAEQSLALSWARNQNFSSVAARYAKLCAEAFDASQAELERVRELLRNVRCILLIAAAGLYLQRETITMKTAHAIANSASLSTPRRVMAMAKSQAGRHVAALIAIMLLVGCSQKPMSNEAIIAETKKCSDSGFDAMPLTSLWSMGITLAIQCKQKVKP